MLLPVSPVFSPSHLGVRLADRELAVAELGRAMKATPPSEGGGWKPSADTSVAVIYFKKWYRGVVVVVTDWDYSVYRLDLGDVITVGREQLRPLPAQYHTQPPGCLQCCLAGVWPVEGGQWKSQVTEVMILVTR